MSFKSFLSEAGHDFVNVFKWLGSSQGQAAVTASEAAAVGIGTAVGGAPVGALLTKVTGLINTGLKGVFTVEAGAAAAGAQAGTGPAKASAVIAYVTPQVGPILQSLGVQNPTEEQAVAVATAVSNGLVAILNSIPPSTSSATPATPPTT